MKTLIPVPAARRRREVLVPIGATNQDLSPEDLVPDGNTNRDQIALYGLV